MEEAQEEGVISPSEITKSSVEAALKADQGDGARLESFSVHEFTKKGDNYATLVAAVRVNFVLLGANQTTSYVVKYNPRRMQLLQDLAYIFFEKEELFYRLLVHEIQTQLQAIGEPPLRVPRCLHSSLEEGQEVIFLEDLRPRGFRMFDRKKGMDAAHTKLVLEELSRLHAASHLLKDIIPDLCEKYPNLKKDWTTEKQITQHLFGYHMESVARVLHDIEGYEEAEAWLLKNKDRVVEMLESEFRRDPPFDLLCHGDCWNNNTLFRYDDDGRPVEVMLVDLQLSRVASVATDLNYLLHTSLTGAMRSENLPMFLGDYHASFSHCLEAAGRTMPFSLAELTQEYRNHLLYGLLMGLLLVKVTTAEENEVAEPRSQTALRDDMKGSLKRIADKNPNMLNRLLCLFDEMIESGVIP